MIDPGNPTEEELKYFFDQIIEYLKEIDFIGVWKNFDYDRTFIDVLVKVIGDCFGFINFLENNGDM